MQKMKKLTSVILAMLLLLSAVFTQTATAAANRVKIKNMVYNASKKTVKVTWKKVKKSAGYQVVYGYKKNFKSAKKVLVKKAKATLKKMKSGKTLYVKVRSFKKKGKKKVYGKFSARKSLRLTKPEVQTTVNTEQTTTVKAPDTTVAPNNGTTTTTTQPNYVYETYPIKQALEHAVLNGRYAFDSQERLVFDWSGTSFTLNLKCGGDISASFSVNTGWGFVMVSVDGGEYTSVKLNWGNNFDSFSTIKLAENLPYGEHTITVVKQTEASQVPARIRDITFSGEFLEKPEDTRDMDMVFFGDSITSGVGIIPDAEATDYKGSMDPLRTYAALTANEFNARYELVSVGGWGLVTDTGGNTSGNLPQFLDYADFHKQIPMTYPNNDMDVAVCNLGQNDQCSATDFKAAANDFVDRLRAAYPNALIVFSSGMLGQKYIAQMQEIIAERAEAGDDNFLFVLMPFNNEGGQWGHPSAEGHRAAADVMIDAIKEKLGK